MIMSPHCLLHTQLLANFVKQCVCQRVCLFAVALSDKLASVVRIHVGWDSVHQSASHIGWTDRCHSCSDLFAKHNEPLRLLG